MPTSTASPPARSATGIGLRPTAAPLAMREVPDQAVGRLVADPDLAADDLLVQVAGQEQGVEGDERLALALEHVEDPGLERLDHRRGPLPDDLRGAVGLLDLDPDRVGPGRGQDDVLGVDQALHPLVLELGVDRLAVGLGIAVDLVEDQDDRLLMRAQLREGLDLPALHVAGDDEEDQVGGAGDLAGQGLADLAADLVDARRVDQDQPRLVEARRVPWPPVPTAGPNG